MSFTENTIGGVRFMTSSLIPCSHAFTTRFGGVSQGVYASMNLGTGRGDDNEAIAENYRLLGEATGIDTGNMAFTRQVHGTEVRIVTRADIHELFTPVPYEADAIVTDVPDLPLICFTADCVPVLLCDGPCRIIAAVHCGWRSSVGDILGKTVKAMESLGGDPQGIRAVLGPSIGFCCFQVGAEVIDAAREYLGGDIEGLYRPDPDAEGKYFLDLRGCNARRLLQLGLLKENIDISPECTVCSHEKYWSHRYTGGERGSQGALIVID